MKRTQRCDLFSTIRASAISFLSIVIFIALGIGIYFGFDWTGSALKQTLHENLEAGNAHDFEIAFPYGISESGLDSFAAIDGITETETQFVGYTFFTHGDDRCLAKAVSLPETIDTFVSVEGHLPEQIDEVAVERGSAETLHIQIGDTVTIIDGSAQTALLLAQMKQYRDGDDISLRTEQDASYLKSDTLKVTAIVESPEYFSISTSSYGVSAEDGSAVNTIFFVSRSAFREDVLPEPNSLLLRSDTLCEYETFSDEYEQHSEELKKTVTAVAASVGSNAFETVKTGSASFSEKAATALNDAESDLRNAKAEITQSESDIQQMEAAHAAAPDSISDEELSAAKAALAQAVQDYDEAETQYLENQNAYSDFLEVAKNITDCEITPLTRSNNICYIYVKLLAEIIIRLKYTLGGLFLIIAILVCYSVITRIIYRQRAAIGIKKANGFRQREITALYLSYTGLSGLIGSVLGVGIAYFAVEPALAPYIDGTFTFTCRNDYFSPRLFPVLLCELLLILLVSYIGCRHILLQDAVTLLQGNAVGKTKPLFYERSKQWNRVPVFLQAVINNLCKDGRRVFATLVGIAGCTALLISCITLKNNVLNSFRCQYDRYYHFDCMISYDSSDEDAATEIAAVLDRRNIPYTAVYRTNGYSEGTAFPKKLTALVVSDDPEAFTERIQLENSDGSGAVSVNGIWLPESLQYEYRLTATDEITYSSFSGMTASAVPTGYYKVYSYHLTCYMDSASFEALFAEPYRENTFLISLGEENLQDLEQELRTIRGYTQIYEYYRSDREDAAVFETIAGALVAVYFTASVLLAVFVLLNLLSSFVAERKTEIIVLLVNGYSVRRARRYVVWDTALLTLIGLAIGVAGGILMGRAAIASFESEYLYLMHTADFSACLIGVCTASLLTFLMALFAFRCIRHFSIADLNR